MKTKIILSDGRILDSSTVMSCKYTSSVNAETDIKIGSACSDSIEVSAWDSNLKIACGDLLTYYRVDGSSNEIKTGLFVAQKPVAVSDNVYKVTAYDYMASKFEASCVSWLARVMFPGGDETYSLSEFAEAVCNVCGVEYAGDGELLNSEYTVHAFALENGTYRQLIQWIAEVGGCYAHMNPDGKLCFAWYGDKRSSASPAEGAVPYRTKDDEAYMTVISEPYYVKSHGAVYGIYSQSHEDYIVSPITAVRVYAGSDEISAGTGVNVYTIEGNPLFEYGNRNEITTAIDNILSRLTLVEYTPAVISIKDDGTIHVGDTLDVYTRKGAMYSTIVMSLNASSGGRTEISSTGNSDRNSAEVVSAQSQKPYTKAESQRDVSKMIQDAMTKVEASIRGANGGVKLDRVDENGVIYETLYMDTSDINTAKNILRINHEGIGFTTDGINGNFTTALSIDGGLVNEWVKTWKIIGAEIECGKGKIGGLTVDNKSLTFDFTVNYPNFTQNDIARIKEIMRGGSPTRDELSKYDVYIDGKIDMKDSNAIQRMVNGTYANSINCRFTINTSSVGEIVSLEILDGFRKGEKISIGANGISSCAFFAGDDPGVTDDITIGDTTLVFKNGLFIGTK